MNDYIEIDEGKILPMVTLFEKQVFFRNFENGNLELDLDKLMQYNLKLYEDFFNDPEGFIITAKNAIAETLCVFPSTWEGREQKETSTLQKNIVNFRIKNFPESIRQQISRIRSEHINKIISIQGILRRVCQPTSKICSIKFICPSCDTVTTILQEKTTISEPKKCTCGRRNGFQKLSEELESIQEMEIEENLEDVGSRQPQKIRLYLEGDLTDPDLNKYQVGNKVEVIGIVRKLPQYLSGKEKEQVVIEYMLKVLSMSSIEGEENLNISEEEMMQFKEIACNDPLTYLANQIAPTISGLEDIKKATVLFLAKGVTKYIQNAERRRGEIHILVVGEAGLAKSALLQNIRKRAANCRMADGKATSRAGLVWSVQKDKTTERWVLEAGDLVLANKGYLLLDEAEKMGQEDMKSIHRPLEQGEAEISKAGIHATLSCNTSLFAVANPKLGAFIQSQPVLNQIDFSPTLLSRFDLIYILKDTPEIEEDTKKARQILSVHMGNLKPELPSDFIKKYFSYIMKLKPKLTPEISEKIISIFPRIRSFSVVNNQKVGLPITPRHLEGIVRLSEASAKIRMSEFVEQKDVDIAQELFMKSIEQFGYDENSNFIDLSKITSKVPSKKDKYYVVLDLLKDLSSKGKRLDRHEIISECQRKFGMNYGEVYEIINALHTNAEIYEPTKDVYELTEKNK